MWHYLGIIASGQYLDVLMAEIQRRPQSDIRCVDFSMLGLSRCGYVCQKARRLSVLCIRDSSRSRFHQHINPLHELQAGQSSIAMSSQTKKLRACLLCSLVQTPSEFRRDGCPNCEQLSVRENHRETARTGENRDQETDQCIVDVSPTDEGRQGTRTGMHDLGL